MNQHQTWNAGRKTGQKSLPLVASGKPPDFVESHSDRPVVPANRFNFPIKVIVVLARAVRQRGGNPNVSPHLPYLLWILLAARDFHDGRPSCLRSHGGGPKGVAITTIHDEKMDSMLTHFCI
jgi:hypothetical protein